MEVVAKLEDLLPGPPSVVTVGVFDGVHLGHQEIMNKVTSFACAQSLRSVAVTFDRDPEEIVNPSKPPYRITTLEQKLRLIADQKIDLALVLPLSGRILEMTAEQFVTGVLCNRLNAVSIVVGEDFAFGKGRVGNADLLLKMGQDLGFTVTVVPPVRVGDDIVSSTTIRQLLGAGKIESANRLLGHAYALEGVVVPGAGFGRQLGFPTANIDPDKSQILPPFGVYTVSVEIDGKRWRGAASIGDKPTLGDSHTTIEVYVIGFTGDLYGKPIEVEFLKRLRDQERFASIEDLKRQIAIDIENVMQF